jgi:hypothetical protein
MEAEPPEDPVVDDMLTLELPSAETLNSGEAAPLALSPALTGRAIAYEHKYVVTAEVAQEVAAWANRKLTLDEHADPTEGYRIETLYLDTPRFDTFHRLGRFATRKYRIRRYGDETMVWLERKRKQSGRVRKRRDDHEQSVLQRLAVSAADAVPLDWFFTECRAHLLLPVCEVHYRRLAWGGRSHGPIRLTIDKEIVAREARGWQVSTESTGAVALLPGFRVVELKFCDSMPTLFRRLLQELPLRPAAFSKYRTAAECVAAIPPRTDSTGGVADVQ